MSLILGVGIAIVLYILGDLSLTVVSASTLGPMVALCACLFHRALSFKKFTVYIACLMVPLLVTPYTEFIEYQDKFSLSIVLGLGLLFWANYSESGTNLQKQTGYPLWAHVLFTGTIINASIWAINRWMPELSNAVVILLLICFTQTEQELDSQPATSNWVIGEILSIIAIISAVAVLPGIGLSALVKPRCLSNSEVEGLAEATALGLTLANVSNQKTLITALIPVGLTFRNNENIILVSILVFLCLVVHMCGSYKWKVKSPDLQNFLKPIAILVHMIASGVRSIPAFAVAGLGLGAGKFWKIRPEIRPFIIIMILSSPFT